jgi:hypothetical protein
MQADARFILKTYDEVRLAQLICLLSQILLKRKQSIGWRGGNQAYATWLPPPSILVKEVVSDRSAIPAAIKNKTIFKERRE